MSSSDNLTLNLPTKISEPNMLDNEYTIFEPNTHIFDSIPTTTSLTYNLYELLLTNINVPSYNLTPDQIIWIDEFIKASPASFEKITSDIKSITSTGEIELNNIPQIVKICADVYYSGAINYNLVNSSNIIAFIKYTINVILTSQLFIIPNVEKEVIQALVDTSLTLLSMNITNIETEIQLIKSTSCFLGFLHFLKLK